MELERSSWLPLLHECGSSVGERLENIGKGWLATAVAVVGVAVAEAAVVVVVVAVGRERARGGGGEER